MVAIFLTQKVASNSTPTMNRSTKRGSTSPPAADSPKNDASPSSNKKLRPSPGNEHATSPLASAFAGGGPQPPLGSMPMSGRSQMNGMPPTVLGTNPTLAHMGQHNMGSPQPHPMALPPGMSPQNQMAYRQMAIHQQQQRDKFTAMQGAPLMPGMPGPAGQRPPFATHPAATPQSSQPPLPTTPSQQHQPPQQQPLQPPPQPKPAATPSPGKETTKDQSATAPQGSGDLPGPSTPAAPAEINGSTSTNGQPPSSFTTSSPSANNTPQNNSTSQNAPMSAAANDFSIFNEAIFGPDDGSNFPMSSNVYDPFTNGYNTEPFGVDNDFDWAINMDEVVQPMGPS